MLIRNAELDGEHRVDVRIAADRIARIAPALDSLPDERVLDARGGALLPGLHDHHLHLFALAAAERSVRCGPPDVHDEARLRVALAEAAADEDGWVRGVAYHESVAGELTRDRLDAFVRDRPVRIQHRSGRMWFLNSAALSRLCVPREPPPACLLRDETGSPDGRVHNGDAWLRDRLGERPFPSLAHCGRLLSRAGVTGVTDATPDNGAGELQAWRLAAARGELPQRLRVLGSTGLPRVREPRLETGQLKILLEDSALPDFEALCDRIRRAHDAERGVAIHCVTRGELFYAIAALEDTGSVATDRIEHASIAPPEAVDALARLGVSVVTQPNFLRERGDRYRLEVEAEDQPFLYRGRGFLEGGVGLAGGTDAPFGEADPWAAMAAAVDRRSAGGHCFSPPEALSPERALALFTSPADSPGAPPLRVELGGAADLCLLDRAWSRARDHLSRERVRATFCAGRLVWDAETTSDSGVHES